MSSGRSLSDTIRAGTARNLVMSFALTRSDTSRVSKVSNPGMSSDRILSDIFRSGTGGNHIGNFLQGQIDTSLASRASNPPLNSNHILSDINLEGRESKPRMSCNHIQSRTSRAGSKSKRFVLIQSDMNLAYINYSQPSPWSSDMSPANTMYTLLLMIYRMSFRTSPQSTVYNMGLHIPTCMIRPGTKCMLTLSPSNIGRVCTDNMLFVW